MTGELVGRTLENSLNVE